MGFYPLQSKLVSHCQHSKKGANYAYLYLINKIHRASKNIKNDKKNRETSFKNAEKMGLKIIGFYALMGEYDALILFEGPNDEAAVTAVLAASAMGDIRTTTLKAFTSEEFDKILDKLP